LSWIFVFGGLPGATLQLILVGTIDLVCGLILETFTKYYGVVLDEWVL
jgi:hypothetical protein